jgi:hypothetical protein
MRNPLWLSILWTTLAAADIAFAEMKRHDDTSATYYLVQHHMSLYFDHPRPFPRDNSTQ